jgi:hypothetical protein
MSVEEVGELLQSLNLGLYKNIFLQNQIDGQALLELNDEKLKELGIQEMGFRLALLRFINNPSRRNSLLQTTHNP